MRSSKYNIHFNVDDKKMLYNSLSCTLVEIDEELSAVLNKLEMNDETLQAMDLDVIEELKEYHFVIADNFDEIRYLKYLNQSNTFISRKLELVVAPTLDCNFECPYCFQKCDDTRMGESEIEGLLDFITYYASAKKDVEIRWFGGEPLLEKETLRKVTQQAKEICERNNVRLINQITTNGYLIDEEIISIFKEYNFGNIQITIDGPPEIHNQRRRLKGVEKDTFGVILSNIKLLISNGLEVNIRINVDETNYMEIIPLFNIFEKEGLKKPEIYYGLERIISRPETKSDNLEGSIESVRFGKMVSEIRRELLFRGFEIEYLPKPVLTNCSANRINGYTVGPKGDIYKCSEKIGLEKMSIGNVKNKDFKNRVSFLGRASEELLFTPFENRKCIECNIMPLCMGGCHYTWQKTNCKNECSEFKSGLIDALTTKYLYETRLISEE